MISANQDHDAEEWSLREFERCTPFIQRAVDTTHGEIGIHHVLDDIKTGKAQIWPLPNSCIITTINIHRTGVKVLNIWLAGGVKKELLYAYQHHIEPWAKAMGCARMTINGRGGWVRAMKHLGVRPIYITMGKKI